MENQEKFEKLRELIEQARRSRGEGRVMRWPEEVRREALRLEGVGVSRREISQSAGIAASLLHRWRQERGEGEIFKELKVEGPKQVRVVVRMPCGSEISNLSVAEAVEFFSGTRLRD